MSDKPNRDPFHQHGYQLYNYNPSSSTFNLNAINNIPVSSSLSYHDTQNLVDGVGFDPAQLSFTDYLHGSMDYNTLGRAFNLSCSSPEIISSLDVGSQNNNIGPVGSLVDSLSVGSAGENINPVTSPDSSVSFSSTEAAADDDSGKTKKDGTDDLSTKMIKQPKKKIEKRKKEPQFAFMTKSEVDHLDDGYRWRKYGQKAVKNSTYPRSYYRCTTQKCTVKKRVERSYQDPSVVITTYEGQHNHQSPSTLRGNAARLLAPSMFGSSSARQMSFPHNQELLLHRQHVPSLQNNNQVGEYNRNSSIYQQNLTATGSTLHQPQFHPVVSDYGLLQDMVPAFMDPQQQQP